MSFDRELQKGNTPTLILAVLADVPSHGYAIAREIERRSVDALKMGEGALYPALRTLETEGLVVSRWDTQASGPARKVYELTEDGRKELSRRMDEWEKYTKAVGRVIGGNLREQTV